MEYSALSPPGPIEEGSIIFVGNGMFKVEWKYKDHTICGIFHRNTKGYDEVENPQPGISICFNKKDVTRHYLDFLDDDDSIKAKTTLENLVKVTKIIDENIEDYFCEYEEDNDANSETK
jgi:hypothetical protein